MKFQSEAARAGQRTRRRAAEKRPRYWARGHLRIGRGRGGPAGGLERAVARRGSGVLGNGKVRHRSFKR